MSLSKWDILLQIAKFYEEMREIQIAVAIEREMMYLDLTEVDDKDNNIIDLNELNLNDDNKRSAIRELK